MSKIGAVVKDTDSSLQMGFNSWLKMQFSHNLHKQGFDGKLKKVPNLFFTGAIGDKQRLQARYASKCKVVK